MSRKAVTSKRVGKIVSRVLQDPKEDNLAKSGAGSALAQVPERTSFRLAGAKKIKRYYMK